MLTIEDKLGLSKVSSITPRPIIPRYSEEKKEGKGLPKKKIN